MSTDFRSASERHFLDAEWLREQQRFANADQLYGLSAECSLKAVMIALGMATRPDGAPADRGHMVHMPEIWAAFQSFAQGRLASRYLDPLDHENPFATWLVDQRYWAVAAIDETGMNAHRDGALRCRESLEVLVLDGVSA